MTNLIWLKGGACSGNTMSFLNAAEPSVIELVTDFGIRILYHPSIGLEIGEQIKEVLNEAVSETVPLDIFVFEGSVIQGSNGTGNMNFYADRPMKDWVTDLAKVAKYVVAIGDCATWGGIMAVEPNPTDSTGMQFKKDQKGGYLGEDFITKSGFPIINIPGCPAHPDWMTQILVAIATGRMDEVLLDHYNRPKTFFTDFVQTGCTNATSFAEVIKGDFGKRGGCLFYEVGCRGPMTHASCNRILWNRTSSKTRANHPCLGCTEPNFPHNDLKKGSVFKTMKYLGQFPKEVPEDESKLLFYFKTGVRRALSNESSGASSK
ncbi:MAG: hydrogenase [Bacteroidota bacterium]